MFSYEKRGGLPKDFGKMKNFRETLSNVMLKDLGFSSFDFTWTNGRRSDQNIH